MFPTSTQERRRSWNSLTTTESWRPRSASTGVIDISPFNRNVSSGQRAPATPCFVSPRMAFSTQFNYDSPIQVLTSSSPCVFKPMSVRNLKKRCSLSRLPPRCKILVIVLCLSLAGSLYFIRSLKEGSETPLPCTGENCDSAFQEHPSMQRFLGSLDHKQPNPHSLTQDLGNPDVELPNAPSLNENFQYQTIGYQPYSVDGTPTEAQQRHTYSYHGPPAEEHHTTSMDGAPIEAQQHHTSNENFNKPGRISGVYVADQPENPVNSTTHLGVGSLIYSPTNSLEVQTITTQDSPLVQQTPESMMHERERRDLATDQVVQQREINNFLSYPGQEPISFVDVQNSRSEEIVYANSPNGREDIIQISQNRPEDNLNNIPQNPQGENVYFYSQNGNQMGNQISSPQRRFEDSSNFQPQNIQIVQENRQPQLTEREIEARLTRHYIPKENSGEGLQYSMDRPYQENRPMQAGYRSGEMPYMRNEHFMYDEPPMERFPPGVNPRRYRNEF